MAKRTELTPASSGEMLLDEFLKTMELTQHRLAKEIGVPQRRIGEIVGGYRTITADTDLRLCRFFGLSDGWRLCLQADYDTEMAKGALACCRGLKQNRRAPALACRRAAGGGVGSRVSARTVQDTLTGPYTFRSST